MKMMGFAGLNLSYVYGGQVGIVARMERSEIRDSRDTGPGLRFAPSGLQRLEFDVIASLLHVIASAAKQSILSLCGKMDCFAEPVIGPRECAPDDKLRVRSPALKPVCPARHIRHSSAIRIEKTARHQPAG